MRHRLSGIILTITITASVAGCGAVGPGEAQSEAPTVATSFEEYGTASCSAWATLFRVVGNPDTADWTDSVRELQAAAEAHDAVTAARLQLGINTELEAARRQIAYAAGWPPAARPMAELDRFFVATEAWINAYVDVATGVPNAPDPQAAFETAGGIDAWRGMIAASADMAPYRPASAEPCHGAPVSP